MDHVWELLEVRTHPPNGCKFKIWKCDGCRSTTFSVPFSPSVPTQESPYEGDLQNTETDPDCQVQSVKTVMAS